VSTETISAMESFLKELKSEPFRRGR
jgi:hypothetical protein